MNRHLAERDEDKLSRQPLALSACNIERVAYNRPMLFADAYQQHLDPFADSFPYSAVLSTFLAALPVVTLFYFLVPRRWLAPRAGALGAAVAMLVAATAFSMPVDKTLWSFAYGAAFGLLPVGWTIFAAMMLYNITVESGQFNIIKRSVASLSGDARIQAVLIGFSFGAFLEGAAGGGSPVAICGAIMVGLGFNPFQAAVLCLIANTSPVAYGGLGTPIMVLSDVSQIDRAVISTMAGHQLPILSFIIPVWMTKCMCTWKQTWEVWPALVVAGASFALFQFVFATAHNYLPGLMLYPMTDIGGGIFSLVVTAIFLRFWKPKREWHFNHPPELHTSPADIDPIDPHVAEAGALLGDQPKVPEHEPPLTLGRVCLAWTPYVVMSALLMATGIVRDRERTPSDAGEHFITPGLVRVPGLEISTNYYISVPTLHKSVYRDSKLHEQGKPAAAESALYNFPWVTAPGSAVFVACLFSIALLRLTPRQILRVLRRTCIQMKIPIPTIAFMLGLSYVTRFSGMDSTLGYAFSYTGALYPFFAAILGWLGVFLTGTDAGSNALFGSLQKITANLLHGSGAFASSGLTEGQAQTLICTANSTGGVMGKMIDAQSICVATAATHQIGKEADIFKTVFWHSIALAAIVGTMTLAQAYVYPFTLMVPQP